ncbi:hypothetical protein E2320_011671 [Naja naja]|nr:hypothetical protein E2320_011671 [Naja naja]
MWQILLGYCWKEEFNKENIFHNLNCDVIAKKTKKDQLNNKTRIQYFHQEKWIYVHKGSTKERHGYCTLGEAFNRLDFSNAILDSRRFNYVVRLLELIAKSQLTSLSGIAQKNFMNILEKVVQKAGYCTLGEAFNRLDFSNAILDSRRFNYVVMVVGADCKVSVDITEWNRTEKLYEYLGESCAKSSGRSAEHQTDKRIAADSVHVTLHLGPECWQICSSWQHKHPDFKGLTFTDLPLCLQLDIMQRLSDGRDIVSLGQVTPSLQVLSEDRLLWKKLCHYHFTDRQIRKRLILSDKGHLDWKKMYFKLVRCYPRKEQYGDTLQLCRHCHILSWKGTDHPCTANNPESCLTALSPQDFINLFRF